MSASKHMYIIKVLHEAKPKHQHIVAMLKHKDMYFAHTCIYNYTSQWLDQGMICTIA